MIYAVNQKGAVARFSLAWTAVAEYQGDVYGLTATGLVKFSGAIEATATSLVQTGKMNLVPGKACTVHPVRVTASGAVPLELVAARDEYGAEQSVIYPVPEVRAAQERERSIPMGKGAIGTAWQITIKTPSGRAAPWSISAASAEINSSKRPI